VGDWGPYRWLPFVFCRTCEGYHLLQSSYPRNVYHFVDDSLSVTNLNRRNVFGDEVKKRRGRGVTRLTYDPIVTRFNTSANRKQKDGDRRTYSATNPRPLAFLEPRICDRHALNFPREPRPFVEGSTSLCSLELPAAQNRGGRVNSCTPQ
jgi:hypothetical protein